MLQFLGTGSSFIWTNRRAITCGMHFKALRSFLGSEIPTNHHNKVLFNTQKTIPNCNVWSCTVYSL